MKRALPAALVASFLALGAPAAPARAAGAVTVVDWSLTPRQIATSCAAEIAKAVARERRIASNPAPATFANTTVALEDLGADLNDDLVAQSFLEEVSPDAKVRATSLRCANDVAAFSTDETANPTLYRRLVAAGKTATHLDAADRALSKLWIQTVGRSGAGLAPGPRAEFVRLSKELTGLELRFGQNIQNDGSTIAISKAQAAGLPADLLATSRATATGYVVRVDGSTAEPFLNGARDEATRRRYDVAYGNIASPANVVLLQRAIAVRYRLAHLMGFPTWAAYQLDPRVDRSPQHIERFLDALDVRLLPIARETVGDWRALAATQTRDPHAVIHAWDVAYYRTQLDRTTYAVDEQQIKRYFPAAHTVAAILTLYQRLLGVRFTQLPHPAAWHGDVTEFAVRDAASGRPLGSFFLDLYPRGGKPGGAFNDPILPVRRLADGSYRPPISAIVVSDWPAPAPGRPALLTHDDVTTFFHEFGHNMAALLTTAPYESLTQFQQDFVEAPSQMLENFTWDPHVLREISSNVDTGAPMPDSLIRKLVASRCATDRLCNAFAATRQIELSVLDLDYHTAGPVVDTTAVYARVAARTTPIAFVAGTHPQASFGHLMGGYDAGYYTYLWSLVYAQDMFTAFRRGGLDNPVVGMRYRRTILAPAHVLDPATEVRNFLGRPMSTEAFYDGFRTAP